MATAHLARKLGLARTTVVARIARLERSGVVAGYGVRLGQRLDATTVRAWCSISVLPKTAPAVLRALEAMAEVEEVSAVSGPFDYLVFLRCTSHEQLDTLLDKVGQLDGVHQTQTSRDIPLSGCAASPFSRFAAQIGKGDDALAAGRPLLGIPGLGRASHYLRARKALDSYLFGAASAYPSISVGQLTNN